MKPSRALYLVCGAALAGSSTLAIPGPGVALILLAIVAGAAAIAFDGGDR